VELDVREDLLVGQEVHFGAALVGRADDLHRRHFNGLAVRAGHGLDDAVLHLTLRELDQVDLPSRRTVRRSHFDSAFTQDTPTPCRPPEPCSCSG
jgi:hypothetical protein